MPRTRRALLAALPAVVGLAGCSTDPGGDTTPDGATATTAATPAETTPPDTTTTTEATAASVELEVTAAVESYLYRQGPGLLAVAGGDEQYLLAEVAVGGGTPEPGEFTVRSSGVTYPMTHEPRGPVEAGPFGRSRYRGGRAGWLAAALPPSLPAAPVVTYRGRSWSVPEGITRRLTDPAPSFSVTAFEAPERVRPDESYSVRLSVRNDGGAGRFRAALNWAGERTIATVDLELPAGGRARWQAGADVPPGDATAMALVAPGRTVERAVTVER